MSVSAQFDRIPETDLSMDSEEAVSAFARAGQPNGILSGVYAFYTEQACRMIRPGDRVLDLGCGPAQLLMSIAALNWEANFIGVDSSAPMIERGNEALRCQAGRNLELRVDDMTKLDSIESKSIDVVMSSMAMHHLPDIDHLHRCFEAIERVLASDGRVFIADFGRLKSLKSIDYFVQRAIPPGEPVLERDYRASLRAAFSRDEFSRALSGRVKQRVSIYATIVSPMMLVLMSPFPSPHHPTATAERILQKLPRNRRADYRQLRLSLSLGGMPC
jgi:ubiquinone/menaquinone biosynthesis C-methylase UbiE